LAWLADPKLRAASIWFRFLASIERNTPEVTKNTIIATIKNVSMENFSFASPFEVPCKEFDRNSASAQISYTQLVFIGCGFQPARYHKFQIPFEFMWSPSHMADNRRPLLMH
jgi:hypothetical protein